MRCTLTVILSVQVHIVQMLQYAKCITYFTLKCWRRITNSFFFLGRVVWLIKSYKRLFYRFYRSVYIHVVRFVHIVCQVCLDNCIRFTYFIATNIVNLAYNYHNSKKCLQISLKLPLKSRLLI